MIYQRIPVDVALQSMREGRVVQASGEEVDRLIQSCLAIDPMLRFNKGVTADGRVQLRLLSEEEFQRRRAAGQPGRGHDPRIPQFVDDLRMGQGLVVRRHEADLLLRRLAAYDPTLNLVSARHGRNERIIRAVSASDMSKAVSRYRRTHPAHSNRSNSTVRDISMN